MRFRSAATTALALGALGSAGGLAVAAEGGGDTKADYTPGERFAPLGSSAPCAAALDDPFVLPSGYGQSVVAREGEGGSIDLWDMNTQNESGREAGRYIYRTHETGTGSQVSTTDLKTGTTTILAQRADWERFDGIVWTPQGTILAAEETTQAAVPDPEVPQARAGLVYEIYPDADDPSRLDTSKGGGDGIAPRPLLGSKSHEGMRFDKQGNHYGISESSPGSIFRFVPDRRGDLSAGTLQAYRSADGHAGEGTWVSVDPAAVQVDAQAEATSKGANSYNRPEDVETGESTGNDRNNGGNTLYVALTGTDEVLAVDLSAKDEPFAYDYVGHTAANAGPPAFDAPDNLALDSKGNLAITEDPGGTPPTKTFGDDVFVAEPQGGKRRPATEVARFASLKDCIAEPTGVYFAMPTTDRYTKGTEREATVTSETLFVNRQHAGQGTPLDQLVAITPSGATETPAP